MQADMKDIHASLRPAVDAAEQAIVHGHDLLLVANPGIGTTMIARRITGIMPELSTHERRWLCAEYNAYRPHEQWAGGLYQRERPFRAPHYSVSGAALVGSQPDRHGRAGRHAGEIRLARFGVLYLDELPEFRLSAIETLGHALRRMHGAPLVVASAAPCPCGWNGSDHRSCVCSAGAIKRYQERLRRAWGMLNTAIGSTVRVPSLTVADLRDGLPGEDSANIRTRVVCALRAAGGA